MGGNGTFSVHWKHSQFSYLYGISSDKLTAQAAGNGF